MLRAFSGISLGKSKPYPVEDTEATSIFSSSFLLPSRKGDAPGKEGEQGAYPGWASLRNIQVTNPISSSICPSLGGLARGSEEQVFGEMTDSS